MNDEMECLCLACGISVYLSNLNIGGDDLAGAEQQPLPNTFCPECGGLLVVVGKKGDEPTYRL